MNHNNDPSKPPVFMFDPRVFSIGGQVGCLTLFVVLAAVGGGIWLDNFFGTKPILMLILVIGSGPLALYLAVKLAVRSVQNLNLSAGSGKTQTLKPEKPNNQTSEKEGGITGE